MKSNIQVKFLSEEEMANAKDIDWRYEHVGADNAGFADKLNNRIYVRKGYDTELNKLLIQHELEHLFELEGTDEDEFGIRHKKKSGGGGGFMSWLLPAVLAVVGTALGGWGLPAAGVAMGLGGLGGIAGSVGATALGSGVGSMLGGATGSSMVGKPNWGQNAMQGLQTGVTAGIGKGLGAATGSDWIGNLSGQGANLGMGMLTSPSSRSGYSSGIPTGWTNEAPPIPDSSYGFGQQGSESITDIGGMAGLSKKPLNPGLGQAGIALGSGSQDMEGVGQGGNAMDSMFNQQIDPIGFNQSNGGMFAF